MQRGKPTHSRSLRDRQLRKLSSELVTPMERATITGRTDNDDLHSAHHPMSHRDRQPIPHESLRCTQAP